MAAYNDFNSRFVSDLQELVTCGICNNTLQIPKTLNCHHTFCLQCLEVWYQRCQTERNPFCCHTCGTPMPVQEDDVNNFPTSFVHYTLINLYNTIIQGDQQRVCSKCSNHRLMVGYCFQCEKMLCNGCYSMHNFNQDHQATLWREFTRENLISYIDSEFVCPVPHHMRKPLEMYCQTCKKAICQMCAATRDHSNHPIVSLGEACEDIKRTARQRKDQLREEIEVHENERMPTVESIQNQLDQVNTALCDVLQAQIPI